MEARRLTMDLETAEQTVDARWHCLSAEESLRRLASSPDGLTSPQAEAALVRYGQNVIAAAKPFGPWAIFLSQFKSVLIWVLVVASVVCGALGDAKDSVAILAIVILNALVGFYQEYSAEKSIAALKRMTAPLAKVQRDGTMTTISAIGVVPGDVIEFEAGDVIAADARLLTANSLTCVEAALTGEAEAVPKRIETLHDPDLPIGDRIDMVFMGTSVAAGSGRAVVVATGMSTEIGHIAALIKQAGEERQTPLQQKLDRFGRTLLWATLGIVMLLFGLGLLRKEPILDMFMTSVSLAVAALPESLPAVATAALSLGVMRMSRRRALVRRLASVETLGSTNVICTDKTGTLTLGAMSARRLFVAGRSYEIEGDGYRPSGAIRSGGAIIDPQCDASLRRLAEILVGCNNAHLEGAADSYTVIGDPTEGALLCAGMKAGVDRRALERDLPRLLEIPFDSNRKLHSMLRQLPDGRIRVMTNGAPEELLGRCSNILADDGVHALTSSERKDLFHRNVDLASEGFRVLGCAYRDRAAMPSPIDGEEVEHDMIFVGLCGLRDPPRPEAREAITKCRTAGIRVVMITGDHPRTAMAIGRELGLDGDGETITGAELDALGDKALAARIQNISVYARVTAAHKLRIVRGWQANNAIVAMTGDGVNDAPAIKGADIGVAMGMTGSEVTKQTSDMVIADDNFATIVDAVEEGRGIFENIRNTLQYLLSCNAGELLLMTICIVAGLPSPLLPIHLLWINLVTDGPPALCLAADRADPGLMNRPPRDQGEALADRSFLESMLLAAALIAAVPFMLFLYGLQQGGLELGRSYAFTSMVFSQLFVALGARSGATSLWRRNPFSNPYLFASVAGLILFQMAGQQSNAFAQILRATPLSLHEELFLLAVSAAPLLVLELVKSASRLCAPQRLGSKASSRPWTNWITVSVLLATSLGAWLEWPAREESSARFVTGVVEQGAMSRTISGSGTALGPQRVEIFTSTSGAVRFLGCEVGSMVAKNQLCAVVGQTAFRAAVSRSREALARARAKVMVYERRLERAQRMLDRSRASNDRRKTLATTRAYEQALGASRRVTAETGQREDELRKAENDLARIEVRMPVAGMVVQRAASPITAKIGGPPLLVVEDEASACRIDVALTPGDIEMVKTGERALIDATRETLTAHVEIVHKTQSRVLIALNDVSRRLAPGSVVAARIEVERRDNALLAPNEALRYAQGRCKGMAESDCVSRLWILRAGKAAAVSVRLGASDGARTEIVGGDLKAGDTLIVKELDLQQYLN